jgi:hypothetical protein
MYHFTDGGLRNVWLQNGFEIKQTAYGESVSIEHVDGLTRAICTALIRKKSRLTGAEFRYIRTTMLLSQASAGKNIIHAMNDAERTIHLVMEETSKGWSSRESTDDDICLTSG